MYTVTVSDRKMNFALPMTAEEIMKAMCPGERVLACLCGGSILELGACIDSDVTLRPLTYQDEEGRRIWERSLRFVLLLAAKRLFPDRHIRIDNSLGYGVYMSFRECAAEEEELKALEEEMRRIVSEDLPFIRETWTREQTEVYFASQGEPDKMHLLDYCADLTFPVYGLCGMYEYFYGAMLPRTGMLNAFSVWRCKNGFVMQMPSPKDPDRPAAPAVLERHLEAFDRGNMWCRVLGVSTVADLNDTIVSGKFREFIRINEALQDKSAAEAADAVFARRAKAVFIAGPSSSGKTTFANRLRVHLRVLGMQPVLVSLDDFYRNKDTLPLEADGKPDLEALDALDTELLRSCIEGLLAGKEMMMPRFDFNVHKRMEEMYPLRLEDNDVLIMEGIHALNPALHEGFDKNLIFKIFITELTSINLDAHNRIRTTDARLLRRIVRDLRFRGTPVEETMEVWASVRRGEERWIFPYQEEADLVFNSVLHYELAVLKNEISGALSAVRPDSPNFTAARRLLRILYCILPAPEDALREIPPLSLLREFIGGNTFYDN